MQKFITIGQLRRDIYKQNTACRAAGSREGSKVNLAELRKKDVIQVASGANLGRVDDLSFDAASARLCALVLFGRPKLFGLLGREEDVSIPWEEVVSIGADVVLVKSELPPPAHKTRGGLLSWLFQ